MPPSYKNIIGARLKEARGDMTQQVLSERLSQLGVSIDRAGISKIEIGERSVYDFEVRALAQILKVKLDWLLSA
jgi:transcriptional regulator with XRE-family HTH domain